MLRLSSLLLFLIPACSVWAQAPTVGMNLQIEPKIGNGQYCLDASGDRKTDKTPVFVYKCHGSENQRWAISASGGNEHAVLGTGGYCLDVRGASSRSNGTPVELWSCHFGKNQRFGFSPDGRIRETESGKCLIATAAKDGAPVVLDNCTNTPDEVFMIRH